MDIMQEKEKKYKPYAPLDSLDEIPTKVNDINA
jgi:hypothetical protein